MNNINGIECVLNAGCSENYEKERNREFSDLNSSVSEGVEKLILCLPIK